MKALEFVRQDLAANSANKSGRAGLANIIASYFLNPGFAAVCNYRMSRAFFRRNRRLLAKIFWLRNVKDYGVYISPSCVIGAGLCLPHPTGIVIGEGVVIGSDVRLYQGVTLGRRNVASDSNPTIQDGVIIYADAVIIGGVTIPSKTVIPAQSFIK